ncbi:MAG: elongation factor P [Deltaproteobacteria bacterium]|nr:elongation factor P [Deltaproteobacteria bacterium]
MSISANQLRPGNIIEYDGKLWLCLESVHKTPGNLRAFIQAKLRSVKDGVQKEFRFSSTEMLEKVSLRERPMQFLYVDGDFYNFMDSENYEQVHLSKSLVGEAANYLLPDAQVKVTFFEESPIGIALPTTLDFTVIEADPGMKTATASASYKNAKIETGVTIKVPQFVTAGDRITISPATGEYVERAKSK